MGDGGGSPSVRVGDIDENTSLTHAAFCPEGRRARQGPLAHSGDIPRCQQLDRPPKAPPRRARAWPHRRPKHTPWEAGAWTAHNQYVRRGGLFQAGASTCPAHAPSTLLKRKTAENRTTFPKFSSGRAEGKRSDQRAEEAGQQARTALASSSSESLRGTSGRASLVWIATSGRRG